MGGRYIESIPTVIKEKFPRLTRLTLLPPCRRRRAPVYFGIITRDGELFFETLRDHLNAAR